MIKELYGTSMIKYDDKEEKLEYYILNNNDEIAESKLKMYGIEIIKKDKESEEKSFIKDLTVNKSMVQEIAKKIMEHMVTPIHLYDVLENFLS